MVGLYYVYIVHLTVMSKEQVKFSFVSDMSGILESCSEQHLEDRLKSVETTILTSHRDWINRSFDLRSIKCKQTRMSRTLSSLRQDSEECECVKVWRPKCIRHADSDFSTMATGVVKAIMQLLRIFRDVALILFPKWFVMELWGMQQTTNHRSSDNHSGQSSFRLIST